MKLRGSCLCGGVEYSVRQRPLSVSNCHCSMCRKAHGSAYVTFAKFEREQFHVERGAELIQAYQSSAEVTRSFCRDCGAKFTFEWTPTPQYLWLAVGTLDDELDIRPQYHIFVGSKASWFEISDDLPQHEALHDIL